MKHICGILLLISSITVFAGIKTSGPIVVYGLSPLYLSYGHEISGLEAIRKRLPEIAELGANVIWLQPITKPHEEDGHGYDVLDYRNVWDVLGGEKALHALVKEAHSRNIRVMLDVVLNHSSEHHPFVKDIEEIGILSRYFNFYQHTPLTHVPYGGHFNVKRIGDTNFVYYFWEHLLNFNYESKELRTYLKDTLAYWVTEFDIDGFRFDASWGPSSRYPDFYPEIAWHLRKIRPEIILMAEDMTGRPVHYENTRHPHLSGADFDWAYDWNNRDPFWISKWSFQTGDSYEETVFNLPDPHEAAKAFAQGLTYSQSEDVLPVRYIENNDTPGSLLHHSLEESKFAATAMFLLPGIPLVFYGQEAGNKHELFELPSFDPDRRMRSYHPRLWHFYQMLIRLRKVNPSLWQGTLEDLSVEGAVVSFVRRAQKQTMKVELDFKRKVIFLNSRKLEI